MEQRFELRMETWPIVRFPEPDGKAKVFDNDPALAYTNAPSFDHLILQLLEVPVDKLHPTTANQNPPTYFMRDAVIYTVGGDTPLVTLRALDNDGKIIDHPLQHKGNVHYELKADFSYASAEVNAFLAQYLQKENKDTISLGHYNSNEQKIERTHSRLQKAATVLRTDILRRDDYFDFMKREHYDGSTTLFPEGVNVDTLYRMKGLIPALREMLTERISSRGEFKLPPTNIDLMQTLVVKADNEKICIYMHLQEDWNDGPAEKPGLYFLYPHPGAMTSFIAKNPSISELIEDPKKPTPVAMTDTTEYWDAEATSEIRRFLKDTATLRKEITSTAKRVKNIKPLVNRRHHRL